MSAIQMLIMPVSKSVLTFLGPTHANAILDTGLMLTKGLVQVHDKLFLH